MIIPKAIRIGGIEYAIERGVPELNNGVNMLMGEIDYNGAKIRIAANCTDPQTEGVTMLHEILHGIARHMDLEMENEEKIVDTFARGLFQVLEDNADRLYDVAPASGKRK